MNKYIITGIILLSLSCIRENSDAVDAVVFDMLDVPYIFDDGDAIGFRPYYELTEQLDILAFCEEKLFDFKTYGNKYCREHPKIPFYMEGEPRTFLFVANLFDHKAMRWDFIQNQLVARFSILDHKEPPVFLMAKTEIESGNAALIPVRLTLYVSRLEIRIVNPPARINGVAVNINNIAETINSNYALEDTTYIYKEVALNNTGPGIYWMGVNTFPTYRDTPARVSIDFIDKNQIDPLTIRNVRLNLTSGVITRLNIEFSSTEEVTISVEINEKWEVIDEGHIMI